MKLNKISSTLRKHGKGALYTSALLSLLAAPSYTIAAETAEEAATAAGGDVEVIEVRGMRGTMTRSLNEKKNTAAIVDAIAAADFGDLPGLSLSDVIENVSGASGHRLKGSQNEISIRGLGSYWGYSTFNGRTITNAGTGRAVNFKKFPSDLVDKVVIYKTQQADLVEGGTSGTIEVGSLRAVDYGKSKSSIEYQAAYNEYYTEADNKSPWGGKLTFSTVQSWETDDFGAVGFSFGATKSSSSNPEENYGGSSTLGACSFKAADGSALTAEGSNRCSNYQDGGQQTTVSAGRPELITLGDNAAEGYENHLEKFDQDSIFFVPDDAYWRSGEDTDERSGIVATFQWIPNDQWDINLDYTKSKLEYTELRHELAVERAKYMNADTLIFDDSGTLLYEESAGKVSLNGENRNQVDEFDGYGIAVDFQATDNLELSMDVSYNESYRYRLRQKSKLRYEDYMPFSLDSRSTVPKLYFGDTTDMTTAEHYYNNVGGELVKNENYGGAAFDPTQLSSFLGGNTTHAPNAAYMEYGRENDERNDDLFAIKFDAEYILEDNEIFTSIKAGVRYSRQHLFDYSGIETALNLSDGTRRGIDDNVTTDDDITYNGVTDDFADFAFQEHTDLAAAVVSDCGTDHSTKGMFDAEDGVGQATNFASFDSECLIGKMLDLTGFLNPDYVYSETGFYDIGEDPDQRSGQLVDVNEDITAGYVMANVDTEIAGYPVTGNIGLRVVKTDTRSRGWGEIAKITAVMKVDEAGEDYLAYESDAYSDPVRTTLSDSYTEFLPSMNLTVEVTDEWLVKVAAYRSLSRFSLNAMSAGISVDTCDNGSTDDPCEAYDQQLGLSQTEGNMMNPYTATNYDLSIEYYPSQDMAVTFGTYWKNFTGGTDYLVEYRDPEVVNIDLDGNETVSNYGSDVPFNVNQVSDTESTIKGFELTYQQAFVELPGVLSGIGVKGAWNHAISDFETPEVASPGISPDANLFGFSKDTASASIYWEGDALSMRLMYKYRSRYFQPNDLPFPIKTNRWVEDSEYVDASVKYKFSKSFDISLKALNLLEEPQVYTRGTGTVSDYSFSGRKFFLSAKYKF